jgi:hypothetical protein
MKKRKIIMSLVNISLFANFRIDSNERLQRMKDSFASMHGINFLNYVVKDACSNIDYYTLI